MTYAPRVSLQLLAALLIAVAARTQHVAWAWVKPQGQGATFTPAASWQHATSGGTVTVDRDPTQQNRFKVTFPGMAPATGIVHACAWGGSHTAVVNSWTTFGPDVETWIELFDSSGGPANDGAFTVRFRRGRAQQQNDFYGWASQPTTASYTPNSSYSLLPQTIDRLGTGLYQITLPTADQPHLHERGYVQVTPFGQSLLRTRVLSWVDNGTEVLITIQCQNANGTPTDGRFCFSFGSRAAPIFAELGSGGHVWANDKSNPSYTPPSRFTDSNGTTARHGLENITRLRAGSYRVHLPNLAPSMSSTLQVSAQGLGGNYPTIASWTSDGATGTFAFVRTWDVNGAAADATFNLLYLTNRSTQHTAWVRVDTNGQGQSWTPDPDFAYTSTGEQIVVSRTPRTNRFEVFLPGFSEARGPVHLTPINGNHHARVHLRSRSFEGLRVLVELHDAAGAPLQDGEFTLHYRAFGEPSDRAAYLWLNDPTNPGYTISPDDGWNGNRPQPSVARNSIGNYTVYLPDLGNSFGTELGNVQVTASDSILTSARIANIAHLFSHLYITVECRDLNGALADREFALSYHEAAAPIPGPQGSGAHVLGNDPTATSYAPASTFTDSNGNVGPANAEHITRLGTGRYLVHLPNVAPAGSATAQVTPYGSLAHHATIEAWGPDAQAGTEVVVRTFDLTGNPNDGAFMLSYLTTLPATGIPATVSSYGTSCNGPQLRWLTRPVAGGNWSLTLSSVPAAASLGFVQIGLSDPNLPLGPSAPGCTQYTSGEAVVLLLTPFPNPAYQLRIPSGAAFLGLSLHAQGGAFVSGINALSLAASNGLLGVVGDV